MFKDRTPSGHKIKMITFAGAGWSKTQDKGEVRNVRKAFVIVYRERMLVVVMTMRRLEDDHEQAGYI